MKLNAKVEKIAFLVILALTLVIVFIVGNRDPVGKLTLALLFSAIIWYRSTHRTSKWIAILILWLGLLIPFLWNFLTR